MDLQDDISMLTDQERDRYGRQLLFPDWGDLRQERLKRSSVFIAGVGGLGSPVALYLAAAGVGSLRLCDSGRLEQSNLNRQVLYVSDDIGLLKAEISKMHIYRLNPDIETVALPETIQENTVVELVGEADLIVDCLDNFTSRYVLNRYSVQRGIPMIYAGISGWAGQLTFLSPPETPCLECLLSEQHLESLVPWKLPKR